MYVFNAHVVRPHMTANILISHDQSNTHLIILITCYLKIRSWNKLIMIDISTMTLVTKDVCATSHLETTFQDLILFLL